VVDALHAGFPVAHVVEPGSIGNPLRSDAGVLASWIRIPQLRAAFLACWFAARRGPAVAIGVAFAVRIALDRGQWPYQFAALVVIAIVLDARRDVADGFVPAQAIRMTSLTLVVVLAMVASRWLALLGTIVLTALAGMLWTQRAGPVRSPSAILAGAPPDGRG
jgi:hypothetical protein